MKATANKPGALKTLTYTFGGVTRALTPRQAFNCYVAWSLNHAVLITKTEIPNDQWFLMTVVRGHNIDIYAVPRRVVRRHPTKGYEILGAELILRQLRRQIERHQRELNR